MKDKERLLSFDEPVCFIRSPEGHTDRVRAVAVSPDGRFIVSGSDDRTVKVWEAESGQLLRSLAGHTGGVNAVAVSPDRRWIISGSDDHTIRAWDPESGESRVLFWNDAAIRSLALSRAGRLWPAAMLPGRCGFSIGCSDLHPIHPVPHRPATMGERRAIHA